MPTILLIGTLDTKGHEFAYVRGLIEGQGCGVLMMDAGVMAPTHPSDIPAEVVAEAGGASLEELRAQADRGLAVEAMMRGVRVLVPALYAAGRFNAVLGLGGGGGTMIATAAMQALPVGVPKLMVSTVAASDVRPYIGVKDITLMYSVVDIAGINAISRRVLANAAGAICGMARQPIPENTDDRPVVAATMFGVTTPCVNAFRERFERENYQVIVFHATGSGGRAMEGLIRDGYIAGVADITTTEWADELVGGVLSAGPERLDAAAQAAIPQVVSVGALDMVNFHAMETVPPAFAGRKFYRHNPNVTLMRTTPVENRRLGEILAQKINASRGPACVMLPLRGVSGIDAAGQPFDDPAADAALFDAIRENLAPHVTLRELDLHINDPAFGTAVAEQLLILLGA